MFNYYRDGHNSVNIGEANPINVSISGSKSFDYKSSINPNLDNVVNNINNKTNLEIAIPLKHLGNFWRSLNIPLINCEVSLELSWNKKCVLVGKAHRAARNPPDAAIPAINSPQT